jgi:hypothetical protein
VETFVIKLLVMAVLAILFWLTVWVSPRIFSSTARASARADVKGTAPAGPAPAPVAAETPRGC